VFERHTVSVEIFGKRQAKGNSSGCFVERYSLMNDEMQFREIDNFQFSIRIPVNDTIGKIKMHAA